jgi:anti-sigma B factor antagonist
MDLRERPKGHAIVLDIHGALDRETGATVELALTVKRLIAEGYRIILLNVEEVTAIDSVVLGAITQCHTSASRAGVTLKLLHPTNRLRELLSMTRLDRFIDLATSEDAELGG